MSQNYFKVSVRVAAIEAGRAVIIILFIANISLTPQGHFSIIVNKMPTTIKDNPYVAQVSNIGPEVTYSNYS